MWAAKSIKVKDGFDHLPAVDAWVRAAPTVRELGQRAAMWLDAEKSMGNTLAYGVDADGPARVGYSISADEVVFIVKSFKGHVYVACPKPISID